MKRIFIFILLTTIFKSGDCQVFGNLIENVIQSTVLVKIGDVSGSGILVRDSTDNISLITAKHVLLDPKTKFSKLHSDSALIQFYASDFESDSANYIFIDLIKIQSEKLLKVDSTHDICVVKIAFVEESKVIKYNNGISRYGHPAKYTPYYIDEKTIISKKNLFLGEDIFIVGFPSSIGLKQIPQFDYDKPLLKRGSVAGVSDKFDNFIIDCPVYHGNSGGPVFLERKDFNTYKLRIIGVVSQFIPLYNQTLTKKDLTVQHSSYAVIVPIEFGLKLLYKD